MVGHRNLKAWQHAHTLAVRCKDLVERFPPDERYRLASQLRSAAYSASLNIAEGHGRGSLADFRRFLLIARASLDEVEDALELARDAGYIHSGESEATEAIRDEAARMLHGLIRSIERRTVDR